ncbi:hypothetical protein LRM41_03475 [Candidatus Nanosynbacter sp. TM7-087]|uniref:hypothetical protein n=1 Tax=Candidatus Nanosynbacter sp. TM7-087 TaxID=2902631 RepID=UPI001FB85836|nr:hypothetical protein [Candidatus Nanosynbacter sp. TM7-087]MCJ1966611.1 hypothetical protein [Candidatus Nanosynbacter sp. TM7-087]
MNKTNKTITIARAIIRIGDAARNVNDYSLLGALHEMVEQLSQHGVKDTEVDMDLLLEYVEAADGCDYCRIGDGKDSVDELTTKINQQLARRSQVQVEAINQSVLEFEPVVYLVTAAYAKNENGVTSGSSIALIVNQDGSVDLPRNHFLNAELLDYFDENRPVNWRSVERDLPSKLHGYHLVAGSVEVQEILPRELDVMSF